MGFYVGSFLAIWIIGYGLVQTVAPKLIRLSHHGGGPDGKIAKNWAFILSIFPMSIAITLHYEFYPQLLLITGLIVLGIVFAINFSVHSYLIVAWSKKNDVAMNVGFYYMVNASGRLCGTILSGWIYQTQGLIVCLFVSSIFILITAILTISLPKQQKNTSEIY